MGQRGLGKTRAELESATFKFEPQPALFTSFPSSFSSHSQKVFIDHQRRRPTTNHRQRRPKCFTVRNSNLLRASRLSRLLGPVCPLLSCFFLFPSLVRSYLLYKSKKPADHVNRYIFGFLNLFEQLQNHVYTNFTRLSPRLRLYFTSPRRQSRKQHARHELSNGRQR